MKLVKEWTDVDNNWYFSSLKNVNENDGALKSPNLIITQFQLKLYRLQL